MNTGNWDEPQGRAATMHDELKQLGADLIRLRKLLTTVHDAGRPHNGTAAAICRCAKCEAWLAVRKELRGE